MPIRLLIDVNQASGNPAPYTGFRTGGAEEVTLASVYDQTPATPAIVGKVLVRQQLAANTGGGNYASGLVANQVIMPGAYGVVVQAATAVGGVARIQTKGVVLAFVQSQANTNKAIALGDPLCLDGAGNLTSAPAAPVTAGTVVATSLAAIAGGTAAALSLVDLGGAY